MYNYIILGILFIILSPGIFLTIPPIGKKWWMTGQTSIKSALLHAVIFGLILFLLNYYDIIEGFQKKDSSKSKSKSKSSRKQKKKCKGGTC